MIMALRTPDNHSGGEHERAAHDDLNRRYPKLDEKNL